MVMTLPAQRTQPGRPRWKLALWVVVALGTVLVGRHLEVPASLGAALDWIRGLGPWGAVIFRRRPMPLAGLPTPTTGPGSRRG
jgi:hypothetical protein